MSVKSKGLRAAFERGMQILFLLCGILAVAFVLFISIYLIIAGLPAIREIGLKEFLFGTRWAPTYKADRPMASCRSSSPQSTALPARWSSACRSA